MLCAALMLALFGCGNPQQTPGTSTARPSSSQTGPTGSTPGPEVVIDPFYQVDYATGHVTAGSIEALLASGESIPVSYDDAYKGTPGFDYSSPEVYTFREYLSSGQNLQWSPLNWKTAEDAQILSYTTMGLYSFVLNSDLSGWTVVCEMAVGAPVDVTQEYGGSYGILEGESAKAWRITLNPDTYWSNGAVINADTYLYSYQQLLDGRLDGSRASEICSGDFAIYGAKEYYSGTADWETVGILATGEYEIVLITEKAVSQPEFYVPYYLQSSYLVYEPLWESCKQYHDAQGNLLSGDCEEAVRITTHYCTSLETSISYGPYTLIGFTPEEGLTLERNFTWYGYADGKHLGQYQADTISCRILSDYNAVLEAYRAGQLDAVTLQTQDVAAYLDSGLLRINPETYTTKLTFNTDAQSLAARGNLVLANAHFRKALSLSIDRSRFAGRYTVPGVTGLGLINELYLADVGDGLVYRNTEEAKNALLRLYGFTGDYEDLTGLDLEAARKLMEQAFAECLADGAYDGRSTIKLQLSVYREEEAYRLLAVFLQEALDAACDGTGFEGKIQLELVVDENCYAAMAMGQTDMILSTWGGNACDPYDLFYSCYCSENRMEYGFDPAAVTVQIEINGEKHIASLLDWARWCAGQPDTGVALLPFDRYDGESRAAIFAQLEFAYLSQYAVTPLYSRSTALLLSERGDYAVKTYRDLVGFGGIRYFTFTCSDMEWDNPEETT